MFYRHCIVKIFIGLVVSFLFLFPVSVLNANPFHDPSKVPLDDPKLDISADRFSDTPVDRDLLTRQASAVIRVDIAWDEATESFKFVQSKLEQTGTDYLTARSRIFPRHGSYIGVLEDKTGQKYYASIGTGKEFRKLSRGLAFRFPAPASPCVFRLIAEDPISGEMTERLTVDVDPSSAKTVAFLPSVETRLIKITDCP